ncbi:MAG: AIR synthase, partial [Firmicutes bacterium]|nr:AIR synthase [Bacillota bacterium]
MQRPLVVGTMAGTARRAELVDKRSMQEGDRILVSKGVAVEGTGLLAREFADRLRLAGMNEQEIGECRAFLDRVSILDEARVARSVPGVTAMHDVTEGGIATALLELSVAGGHALRVDKDKIPVYPQTARICALLGLDPLGLIGSGSLLITCAPSAVGAIVAGVRAKGIEITEIGEVLGPGEGVQARENGAPA